MSDQNKISANLLIEFLFLFLEYPWNGSSYQENAVEPCYHIPKKCDCQKRNHPIQKIHGWCWTSCTGKKIAFAIRLITCIDWILGLEREWKLFVMKKQKACLTTNQLVKYICCCLPSDSKKNILYHSIIVLVFQIELSLFIILVG